MKNDLEYALNSYEFSRTCGAYVMMQTSLDMVEHLPIPHLEGLREHLKADLKASKTVCARGMIEAQLSYVENVLKEARRRERQLYKAITGREVQDDETPHEEPSAIADTTPALFWTGRADGSIDFVNPRWLAYSGLREEDALGDGWTSVLHPDDSGELLHKWETAVYTGTRYEALARLRGANGEYSWFLHFAAPMRDCQKGAIIGWSGMCVAECR
jgi:PAS domain S-box-containing protein